MPENEDLYQQKWKIVYRCLAFRFFTDGVEYSIILPTLYNYLVKRYETDVSYVGVIMAAYAFGGLISAPFIGPLADRTGETKNIITFGCIVSFLSNMSYAFSPTKELVALARFFAGLNCDPLVLGEIGRINFLTEDERSKAISGVFIFRQMGVLVGPLVVILGSKMPSFYVLNTFIDQNNSGSLFNGILYFISTLSFIFLYDSEQLTNTNENETDELKSPSTTDKATLGQVLLYEPIWVGLFGTYVIQFQQSSIEAVLAPLTSKLFGWNQNNIALLFLVVGSIAIVGFISTTLSGVVKLTNGTSGNLRVGIVPLTLVFYVLLVLISYATPQEKHWFLPSFISMTMVYVFFMPYIVTSCASIISSSTPVHLQSTLQAIRTISGQISLTLGAYISTFLLQNYGQVAPFVLPLVHCTLMTIFTFCSKKALTSESLKSFKNLQKI